MDFRDQVSIIWYECYHDSHNHSDDINDDTKFLDNPIHLNVPIQHLEGLYIAASYGLSSDLSGPDRDAALKWTLDGMLNIDRIGRPERYEHEIETYKAEIANGLEVSHEYFMEREFNLWYYEQLAQISHNLRDNEK